MKKQPRQLSEAKRKELETRKALGPRLGQAKAGARRPTAPPSTGGPRKRVHAGKYHPTRDSG